MFSKLPAVALLCILITASAFAQQQNPDSTAAAVAPSRDTTTAPNPYATKYTLSPSLNVSISSDSKQGYSVLSGDWLSVLSATMDKEGELYQFSARLDATYGQHISNALPQKTADNVVLSFTPSRTIVPSIGLRLLLEVAGQTQFTKGMVDSTVTNFSDPLFVYQSLFVGKKIIWASEDGQRSFNLTAGVGYALQQTEASNFLLRQNRNIVFTNTNPVQQPEITLESGYCAIVDVNYSNIITNDLQITAAAKTVALTKDELTMDFTNARVTSIFSVGFQYKFINLTYSGNLVYDPNVSLERDLSQFLGVGIKANW